MGVEIGLLLVMSDIFWTFGTNFWTFDSKFRVTGAGIPRYGRMVAWLDSGAEWLLMGKTLARPGHSCICCRVVLYCAIGK